MRIVFLTSLCFLVSCGAPGCDIPKNPSHEWCDTAMSKIEETRQCAEKIADSCIIYNQHQHDHE